MAEDNWEKQEGSGGWIPQEEGEVLQGTVTDVFTEGRSYGPQWQIKKADGEEVLTPSHKVLQNRLSRATEGSKVRIVYKGEEPPSVKGQNPTKIYDVFIKKEGS